MKRLGFLIWTVLVFLLVGCSSDLTVKVPAVPSGKPGMSAYEIWKEKALADGVTNVTEADYLLSIKGQDGANGQNGQNGQDGKSAYELWKEMVVAGNISKNGQTWPADNVSEQDFWRFLTGANGADGQTPHVGENGNWFIGNQDTGIKAKGQDGAPGTAAQPIIPTVGENGNWFINGEDTGKLAKGQDGANGVAPTVTIVDGFWAINGEKTDKTAVGESGRNSVVTIGDSEADPQVKHWFINGTDTGVPVYGQKGPQGDSGKSAYELWKESVTSEPGLVNPKAPDSKWPKDRVSEADFFLYLSGRNGSDGRPGTPGLPGESVYVVPGVANVIAQYSQQEYGEYVRTSDGGVAYKVFDTQGNPVGEGAKVKGLPGMDPEKTYTTDSHGEFVVPRADLPSIQSVDSRFGTVASLILPGQSEPTPAAPNTYVPNRIDLTIEYKSGSFNLPGTTVEYLVAMKRNPDDQWEPIPAYLSNVATYTFGAYELANASDVNTLKNPGEQPVVENTLTFKEAALSDGGNGTSFILNKIPNEIVDYRNTTVSALGENAVTEKTHNYTVKSKTAFYGVDLKWDGRINCPPTQYTPPIKKIKVTGKTTKGTASFYALVEGEFNVDDHINKDLLYVGKLKSSDENGHILVTPLKVKDFPSIELDKLKAFYFYAQYQSDKGGQNSSSEKQPSSIVVKEFSAYALFLGAELWSKNVVFENTLINEPFYSYLHPWKVGDFKDDGGLKVEHDPNLPDVEIIDGDNTHVGVGVGVDPWGVHEETVGLG